MMSEEITIKGGQLFITENAGSLYEITSGDALIYIVPVEKDMRSLQSTTLQIPLCSQIY